MPLFSSKKIDDSTWIQQSRRVVDGIEEISSILLKAGKAIEQDQIDGWVKVSDIMSSLNQYQITCNQIESNFKNIGSPQSDTCKHMEDFIKKFFTESKWAFHWGKHHYKDASGGSGRRAKFETHEGLRKASTYRVTNNGTKFFTAALNANACAIIIKDLFKESGLNRITKSKENKKFVPLVSMFLDQSLEMFSLEPVISTSKIHIRNQINSSAWLFETGAIIGSLFVDDELILERFLGNPDNPGELIEEFKTGSKQQMVVYENSNHEFDSLAFFYEYIECKSFGLNVWDKPDEHQIKEAMNFLKTTSHLEAVYNNCTSAFTQGIGFGLNYPELTKSVIKNYGNPTSLNDFEKLGLRNVDFKDLGFKDPKEMFISYEDRADFSLKPVLGYVKQYFPDLEKQLNFENKLSDYKTQTNLTKTAIDSRKDLMESDLEKCNSCGATIIKGNNFCVSCGEKICSSCGATIKKGNNFCVACGKKI